MVAALCPCRQRSRANIHRVRSRPCAQVDVVADSEAWTFQFWVLCWQKPSDVFRLFSSNRYHLRLIKCQADAKHDAQAGMILCRDLKHRQSLEAIHKSSNIEPVIVFIYGQYPMIWFIVGTVNDLSYYDQIPKIHKNYQYPMMYLNLFSVASPLG